ncbi:hypothetical protein C8Q75DRAFT_343810 [Abortiporus biennis]|nr:hypothetical protein C8Q75DRAFT_343810 [Abortiporus biennis]
MSISTHSGPRPSFSSSMTQFSSENTGRSWSTKKENQFIMQNDSKLHAYGRDKAPYPLSYNREVLELCLMDHALILRAKQAFTFVDFKEQIPQRVLDIGTGVGDWVIDAAKTWTDCTFVGYDLVNIQIPLYLLDHSISARIQWVHGNLLRTRLPFDDDEFDFVHIKALAFAVPENKWSSIFEEINRVLRPGGTVEMIEEDAIFPVLPRWFTAPLHAQAKRPSALFPDGSSRSLLPNSAAISAEDEVAPHDHALLESLFMSVFENRFINTTPSAILPGYFSAVFTHVLSPPVLSFPMPPLAPLSPLPGELASTPLNDLLDSHSMFLSDSTPELYLSSNPSLSSDVSIIDGDPVIQNGDSDTPSALGPYGVAMRDRTQSVSTIHSESPASSLSSTKSPSYRRSLVSYAPSELTTVIGHDDSVLGLFPFEELSALDPHSLYMQLYRAVGVVLAVKEAMWDELKQKLKDEKGSLQAYGWDDQGYLEDVSRQKFDALVERYKGDMQLRISLWHSLTEHGWPYPQRDPLSKAELVEEERLRRAILEARKCAPEEEFPRPVRSVRLLVGTKAS